MDRVQQEYFLANVDLENPGQYFTSIQTNKSIMKAKVAVLTQSLSSGFYFPVWYSYYSKHCGAENLFVVTQGVTASEFAGFDLGGIIRLPDLAFDEGQRVRFMSKQVAGLLEHYETVITVDSDEILVPDPSLGVDLRDFVNGCVFPYVTSIGIEVFQMPNEPPLNVRDPILLHQRSVAYLNSSLCKTSVTRVNVQWGVGYHYCSLYPAFNNLYLFHLKRADKELQLGWMKHMSRRNISTEQMRTYFAPELERIEASIAAISKRPFSEDDGVLSRKPFFEKFLNKIKYDTRDGIYRGEHFADTHLLKIPDDFRGVF